MKLSDATEQFIDETDGKQPSGRSLNAQKHGAHGYLKRTKEGDRITHDLRLVESAVVQQAEEDGPASRMFQAAVRLGTAGELLWSYMAQSADSFKKGLKQFGWLAGAEVRAWDRYAKLRQSEDSDDVATRRVLQVYTDGDDNRAD